MEGKLLRVHERLVNKGLLIVMRDPFRMEVREQLVAKATRAHVVGNERKNGKKKHNFVENYILKVVEKLPENLNSLISFLKKLPGVGIRTAERFAFEFLSWPK